MLEQPNDLDLSNENHYPKAPQSFKRKATSPAALADPAYLERSLRRLRTSWRASLPAAWLPQHSVARARWLVRRLDT